MTIGGYYSEIIARIVGPTGKVLLINNPPCDGFAKKGLATRLAGNRLPNVKYEVLPPDAKKLHRIDPGASQHRG